MAKEIEFTTKFVTKAQREMQRKEKRAAMVEYEENNDCTLVIKSNTQKHYPSPGANQPDYWVETTICEVYEGVISPTQH
jgi:hypothetical protein